MPSPAISPSFPRHFHVIFRHLPSSPVISRHLPSSPQVEEPLFGLPPGARANPAEEVGRRSHQKPRAHQRDADAKPTLVRLDAMMRSVQLPVSAASALTEWPALTEPGSGYDASAGGAPSAEPAGLETEVPLGSGREASVSREAPRAAWVHVGMQGGQRVLTISMERLEPLASSGEDDVVKLFLGISLAGLGVSIVHVGHEELLYLSGQQAMAA